MSDDHERETTFGPNVWLIDEMYRQFVERPDSVSPSWREFLSDYTPAVGRSVPSPPTEGAPRRDMEGVAAAAAAVAPKPAAVPEEAVPLRGPAARLVENMEASLGVPTATTQRQVPVKLADENRRLAIR